MNSSFRTIEISNPGYERDQLRFITVKSKNLVGRGDILVFIPPGISEPVPVAILLHGVYGSAWSWALSGGVHITALKMMEEGKVPPMIIAMPSDGLWGDGSGYLPHGGYDFEKWIAEDVPAVMMEYIQPVTTTLQFFIGGLSMGGFGALKIGCKYHQRFDAISVHSSITHLEQMKLFVEEDLHFYRQVNVADEDCFQTIMANRNELPPLRMDCGKADLLVEQNRELHKRLTAEGIEHVYEEFEGGHEWSYWQEHVKDSLKFFAQHIRP